MAKRDFYEVLGVQKDVSARDLKKAYRALAMQFHPDRNPDDAAAESRFKECAEAYSILNDAEKRALYDRYGHAGLESQGGFGGPDMATSVQDFFESVFGGGGFGGGFGFGGRSQRRDGPQRGGHVRTAVTLTLAECMTGVEREIELRHASPCDTCEGTGARGGKVEKCTTCAGMGRVAQRRPGFLMQVPCPTCQGQGSRAAEVCGECKGGGEVLKDRKIRVPIPAGVDEGAELKMRGKGQAGTRGGPPGDLYIVIRVEAKQGWGRDGADLLFELRLNYAQAVLGATLVVPSVVEGAEGTTVSVPAGIQPNETIVVRGAGMPRVQVAGAGDLICVINIDVPKEPSPKARELIEQLRDELAV